VGEAVVTKALSVTDSIFVIMFIGLGVSCFFLIRWILNTNNEREKRYIDVIDTQAKSLQGLDEVRGDVKDIKNMILGGRVGGV
jgi:hypothetical protein